MFRLSVILLLIGAAASFDEKFKLCATDKKFGDLNCDALSRGSSKVSCLRVTDIAECAMRMSEGKADFAIFNAEQMLLAYQFYPDTIQVISQLRNNERVGEEFTFQSVVVVPSSFDARNGTDGLENAGLCHPGFSKSQIWSDWVLKYFEKRVDRNPSCRHWNITLMENQINTLKDTFGKGCRPGEWVADESIDKDLKSRYPELCELCDDKQKCSYHNTTHHGHFGALECLISGRGNVAYVAHEYVRQFFGLNKTVSLSPLSPRVALGFKYLCEDGSTKPLTSDNPCAWIRQPWSAVVARKEKAAQILDGLEHWLVDVPEGDLVPGWISILKSIITSDNARPNYFNQPLTLKRYLIDGRKVDFPEKPIPYCAKKLRWCTINEQETQKCKWIAKTATIALDIVPKIECVMANSTFECLRNITQREADIITIDSNYGHIARQVFNLTPVMYAEPRINLNSQVIAIVRDDAPNKVTSFRGLKKRNACFPEYGGIAWLSFINTVRTGKLISDSCDYSRLVAEFLTAACTPGIRDTDHSIPSDYSRNNEASSVLCSLCPLEQRTNLTCSANQDNLYYGDKGALECLKNGGGDVAFIETKNLLGYIDSKVINPKDYRVLCKNGSLAIYTGFDIDEPCALSVTIDSEVIGREEKDKWSVHLLSDDVTLTLLKLQDGPANSEDVPIELYKSFTGSSNLLFKDSTVGLEPPSSEIKSVLAYKELFSHVESCSGVENIVANFFTIFPALSIALVPFLSLF